MILSDMINLFNFGIKTIEHIVIIWPIKVNLKKKTGIHWLDQGIVRKQLDIMPSYHYEQNQGKLMMQSQENGQKPYFGQFLMILRPNISK